MIYGFLGLGFLLLLAGSEAILRGGNGICRSLGLPPIVVSLFIVSIAMAAPEFAIVLQATARGLPDIALGDIIGSSLANLLLVLGLGALVSPIPAPPRTVFRDGGYLIAASLVIVGMLLTGSVSFPFGAILVAGWVGYIALAYLTELGRAQQLFTAEPSETRYSITLSFFILVIGVACLVFGARFTIDFAVVIARGLRIPEAAFALTIVAFGTALPELVSTLASAQRRRSLFGATQVLASSTLNLLLVLGVAAIVHPLTVAPLLSRFDAPILAGSAIVVATLMLFGWRLTRSQGFLLFLGYVGYMASILVRSGYSFHT